MNLAFDMSESLPLDDTESIELPQQLGFEARQIAISEQKIEPVEIVDKAVAASSTEQVDVKAELDLLLMSLQLATPHPPSSGIAFEVSLSQGDDGNTKTITYHQQLLDQLDTTEDRINSVYTNLQIIHHQNQSQVDAIDNSILEIKQLKFQTQQLANYSKNQLEKAGSILDSIDQKQESIQSLSQTILSDRLQITGMSVDLHTKLNDLHQLNTKVTTTHTQIVEISRTMRSRITEIERGFGELSASVQTEKEQFYELTAAAIEKADAISSQLANIVKQMSADRDEIAILVASRREGKPDVIATLTAEIESVRHVHSEVEQKLHDLDLGYQAMVSTWADFQARQKNRAITTRNFSRWLWILSFAVVGMLMMLVRILTMLK